MQRPRGAKEDAFPPPVSQSGQQISRQHAGTAAAARAAAVDILPVGIEDETAAVRMVGQSQPLLSEQFQHQGAPQLSQIAGHDQIIKSRGTAGIPEMSGNGVSSGRGACQGCTIKKFQAVIMAS